MTAPAVAPSRGNSAWLHPRRRRVAAAVALAAVLILLGVALARSQAEAKLALERRFQDRMGLAATFVETYLGDLRQRQRQQAALHLGDPVVSTDRFERAADAMGFKAALLLDGGGRVLHVLPHRQELVGVDLAKTYAHLSTALAGVSSVSEVVPSAATGDPIVAFALPFGTASGRRVFSGGFNVERGAIGRYLEQSIPIPGIELYLVDSKGTIAASSGRAAVRVRRLPQVRPTLWRETATTSVGHVEIAERSYLAVARAVAGTPYRLVGAAPEAEIIRPVTGAGRLLPWGMLGLLGAVAVGTLVLLYRLADAATRLEALNGELAHVARLDRVTALYNRRHVEDVLARTAESAQRRGEPFGVVMIDIDHFKSVNDRLGHHAGDEVLQRVAERISSALRPEDVLGRWGGEEFLAVLPRTSLRQAKAMAQRVRIIVSAAPVSAGGGLVAVTASFGCAAGTPRDPQTLVDDADAAMYRAKASGRDAVVAAEPSVSCSSCGLLVPVSTLRVRMDREHREFECPHCAAPVPPETLEELVSR